MNRIIKSISERYKGEKQNTKQSKWVSETDKSHYKPNVSRLNVDMSGAKADQGLYEFPDGKDNGDRYYTLRSLSADVVDKDQYIEQIKREGKLAEAQLKDIKENVLNEYLASKEPEKTTETKVE